MRARGLTAIMLAQTNEQLPVEVQLGLAAAARIPAVRHRGGLGHMTAWCTAYGVARRGSRGRGRRAAANDPHSAGQRGRGH